MNRKTKIKQEDEFILARDTKAQDLEFVAIVYWINNDKLRHLFPGPPPVVAPTPHTFTISEN